jgi:hypothetical protein
MLLVAPRLLATSQALAFGRAVGVLLLGQRGDCVASDERAVAARAIVAGLPYSGIGCRPPVVEFAGTQPRYVVPGLSFSR